MFNSRLDIIRAYIVYISLKMDSFNHRVNSASYLLHKTFFFVCLGRFISILSKALTVQERHLYPLKVHYGHCQVSAKFRTP